MLLPVYLVYCRFWIDTLLRDSGRHICRTLVYLYEDCGCYPPAEEGKESYKPSATIYKEAKLFLLFFTNCGSLLIHSLLRGASRCGVVWDRLLLGVVGDASRECHTATAKWTEQGPTRWYTCVINSPTNRMVSCAGWAATRGSCGGYWEPYKRTSHGNRKSMERERNTGWCRHTIGPPADIDNFLCLCKDYHGLQEVELEW